MYDRFYESLATDHVDELRREAADRRLAAMVDRTPRGRAMLAAPSRLLRESLGRVASVVRRAPVDVARPRGDLGSPRRPQLGQDVLDMRARRLRRDPE